MSLILALDFGGTKLAAATAYLGQHEWCRKQQTLSPPQGNRDTDWQLMQRLAEEVLGGEKPEAIGVSFGGPCDGSSGFVRLSHHVPGWENTPLQEWLVRQWQVPVRVDNDANVAALGEYRFGSGMGYDSLLYLTISTGVGGGWILNGKPWRGRGGIAGEIGHTVVDRFGSVCLCGKRGCVERLASGPYIALDVKEKLARDPERGKILRQLVGDLASITAKDVAEAAHRGDEVAIEALQRAGWAIGVGIGNTANLIAPDLFVLGGGVTKSGDIFWNEIHQAARETALPEVEIAIAPAALGDEAPLWGAVALAEEAISTSNS